MTADHEPREVEARLRASLRAYADVVDDVPPARSSTAAERGARQRSSLVRRWRTPALVAAAVLAVAGGAWVVADGPAAEAPTAAPASALADSDPGAAAAQPPDDDELTGTQRAGDEFAAPAIGVPVPFELYTHCGVLGTYLEGVWFAAETPLVEGGPLLPGGANPPEGWGNPYQVGTLTLETADTGVFRDDLGHEVRLRLAPDEAPPPCD